MLMDECARDGMEDGGAHGLLYCGLSLPAQAKSMAAIAQHHCQVKPRTDSEISHCRFNPSIGSNMDLHYQCLGTPKSWACLVHSEIQKVFKISRHIESCGTYMKH